MTESPPALEGRPTLKTIAAATGLAIATVSRALKDAPDIGEDTKRRVRETALQLGYRPNRAGVRLRTGKTNVIALVLSTETDVMNHTSQLIYSIAADLRGTAYHLVVMPYFPDQDPMEPIRYIVETESADGIVLNQTQPDDPRVRYMAERGFPFATHGRTEMGLDHPYFDYDNEAFARADVQALAARGRRSLLLIAPPRAQCYARHMITGFMDEAAQSGARFEVLTSADSEARWQGALGAEGGYHLQRLWRGVTDHHIIEASFLASQEARRLHTLVEEVAENYATGSRLSASGKAPAVVEVDPGV